MSAGLAFVLGFLALYFLILINNTALSMRSLQSTIFIVCFAIWLALPGCTKTSNEEPQVKVPKAKAQEKSPIDSGDESKPLVVEEPDKPRPHGMVWIPGAQFQMGSTEGQRDEFPIHAVELDGFWMDSTEVTNAEFKRFVDATGYKTIAERRPRKEDFANQMTPEELAALSEDDLQAGSVCFNPKFDQTRFPRDRRPNPSEIYLVWKYEKGANWLHPNGPESTLAGKMDHPVAHVAWDDCVAYCEWSGKGRPSEAQWEYAARGGLEQKTYPWGDNREIEGKWMANIWQGKFPFKNYAHDGFEETSPVMSYPPNDYGLYEMSGNVWEWCNDFYQPEYYTTAPKRNPTGPSDSYDPNEPNVPKRVQRGGSFMCNANYCTGYRVAARMKGDLQTGTWHCGFRCVVSAEMYSKFSSAEGARFASTNKKSTTVAAPPSGE